MDNNLIRISGGIAHQVGLPQYGQQDYGITPQGAVDWLSFTIAHILVGEAADFVAYEIISAPKEFVVLQDVILVITGAEYANYSYYSQATQEYILKHNTVTKIAAGSTIKMSGARVGLRTYVIAVALNVSNMHYIGLQRDRFFHHLLSNYSNVLDVTAAPEFDYLINPERLLQSAWQISNLSDNMGVRLSGEEYTLAKYDILSSAVCDGTIQFTPNQPIVLLSNHQTIGGYPRVLVVTRYSLTNLVQTPPNKIIRFNLVSLEVARDKLYAVYHHLNQARISINKQIMLNKAMVEEE